MPRRFSTNTRKWIYTALCYRDGEFCQLCFDRPTVPLVEIPTAQNESSSTAQNSVSHAVSTAQNRRSRRHKITLDIDHVDSDETNNSRENLRLLCRSCNVKEYNRRRAERSDLFVCVEKRRRADGNSATRLARRAVDYSTGSAEMRANNFYEVRFRNWIMGRFEEVDYLEKDDVVNSGAEVCGCSTATISRYLSKLTSSAGPLREQQDLLGRTQIVLKPELAEHDGED